MSPRQTRIARLNAARICVCDHRNDMHKTVSLGEKVTDFVWKCTHVDVTFVDQTTEVETPCRCTEFVVAKHTKTQKRSFKKGGSKYELDVKRAAEAHGLQARKIAGAGNVDVVVGPEGDELLAIECHHAKDAKTYGHQKDKLQQAARLAKGRAGGPLPVYVYRHKLGHGEPTVSYAFMDMETLFKLVRRLDDAEAGVRHETGEDS